MGESLSLLPRQPERYYGERQDKERYTSSKAHSEDELVDVFTQVIRLADHYGIDLVEATRRVRQAEDEFLTSKGRQGCRRIQTPRILLQRARTSAMPGSDSRATSSGIL